MRARLLLASILTAASLLGASPARAGAPCTPAWLASDGSTLPEPWRAALVRLMEATRHPGRPWSCNGARLELQLDGDGRAARLAVEMEAWPRLEREIPSPDDLVPIGEAMLARPLPRAAAAPAVASSERQVADGVAEAPDRAPPAGEKAAPRLMIGALADTRYSGHLNGVWVGGGLRVMIPVDAWMFGIWARYEVAVAEMQPTPVDFHVSSGSVGLSAGYRVLRAPIELTATLEPSLAVVSMDGGVDGTTGVEGARGDFRLGARITAALPFGDRWRALFALDGEIAPQAIASLKHRSIDPTLPPIPSFTLGASIGGEIVIR